MKKLLLSVLAIGALTFTSCSNDDEPKIIEAVETCNDGILNNGETEVDCGGPNCSACPEVIATCSDGIMNGDETEIDFGGACSQTITVTGELTVDTTWERGNIYLLGGKVVVGVGKTLTIEPGTIIKGKAGTGSLASALVVQRGAKINAVGTADRPIIFTSEQDNIKVGETAGTNLDETYNGLWGGLLVLGNAPASLDGVTETQIEGIPASDAFGLYGGAVADDDSGDLAYISIRHGGALIGEGNEINGLTLGGVGSETTIDNIEIIGNEDDGIEIFGGTVNVSNIFVWAVADDGIDLDQAWTGTLTNGMVVQGVRSDSALELDGPEGTADGAYTLNNITLIGNTEAGEGGSRRIADFRDGLQASINNVHVSGFLSSAAIRLNGDKSATTYNDGLLTLTNWDIVLPEGVATVNQLFTLEGVTIATDYTADASNIAEAVTGDPAEGVGADTSKFAWTYANTKAGLGF